MLNAILFLAEYQRGAPPSSGKPIFKIGEAYSGVQELTCKIDGYIDTMSLKLGLLHCRGIMDLALDRLRSEVQRLETDLDSGEFLGDLGELLQKLKDGALSTPLIRPSVQYTKYYVFLSRVPMWCPTQQRQTNIQTR
jgi:hypothetical protein